MKIENGRIFLDNGYGTIYDFEIVEKIPAGFEIWNIGGLGEYIPVCQTISGSCNVDITTLKAIRLTENEVAILNSAAGSGIKTLNAAEKALKSRRRGYWSDMKRTEAGKTINIFRKITA